MLLNKQSALKRFNCLSLILDGEVGVAREVGGARIADSALLRK